MAEVVVSAILPVLFEKLTSAALKSIARYKGINADIKKLHRSLTRIQDVLADASRKEITSQAVKRWLNDLQHLAYDIDDALDDLATDAMEREFTHESDSSSSKNEWFLKRKRLRFFATESNSDRSGTNKGTCNICHVM